MSKRTVGDTMHVSGNRHMAVIGPLVKITDKLKALQFNVIEISEANLTPGPTLCELATCNLIFVESETYLRYRSFFVSTLLTPAWAEIPVLVAAASGNLIKTHRIFIDDGVSAVLPDAFDGDAIEANVKAWLRVAKEKRLFMPLSEGRSDVMQALRSERDKLEVIFQESPAAMAILCGSQFRLEKANASYLSHFSRKNRIRLSLTGAGGKTKPMMLTDLLTEVFHSGKPFVGSEICSEVLNDEFEVTETHYLDISLVRIDTPVDRPYGIYKHCVDVTDRVASRRAFEVSREQLSLALESGKLGFFDRDILNNVTMFSGRMMKDWGLTADTVLDPETITGFVHPEDRALRASKLAAAQEQHLPYQHEFRIIKPNGTVRWMESNGQVMYDKLGRAARFFGTCKDITSAKLASDQLRIAKENAERANQTKSAFLANMSHEIRTPLSAIIGFSDLMCGSSLTDAQKRRYTEIIARSARGLASIIDDILDLSKVEAGHLKTENTEVNLFQLLNDVIEMFETKAISKNLDLQLELEQTVPNYICSDGTRLRQILINLLGNAVKFTARGEVVLRVKCTPLHGDACRLCLEIADTGPGISAAEGRKLFKPFVQADNSTTRKHGGTGLGLALSKRLAKALNGNLTFKSQVDRGTVFTLELNTKALSPPRPLPPIKVDQRKQISPQSPRPLAGLRILVADDSVDNQILINTILSGYGASIATVDNGLEAVKRALSEHFDLILMDIQMPIMDGNEATKSLRRSGYDGPIYALTAHAMVEEREKSRDAGCNGHLTKPLDLKSLLKTVSEAGHRRHNRPIH